MTETVDTPAPSIPLSTWLALGFIAGFLSVLTFHQGAGGVSYLLGWGNNPPYSTRATWPLGVPQFISLAFWGGVWIMVFALVSTRLPASLREGVGFIIAGMVFGSLVIGVFNWFVLAPLRGQPLGNGFILANMVRGMTFNGIFGLGAALWMLAGERLLAARRAGP